MYIYFFYVCIIIFSYITNVNVFFHRDYVSRLVENYWIRKKYFSTSRSTFLNTTCMRANEWNSILFLDFSHWVVVVDLRGPSPTTLLRVSVVWWRTPFFSHDHSLDAFVVRTVRGQINGQNGCSFRLAFKSKYEIKPRYFFKQTFPSRRISVYL